MSADRERREVAFGPRPTQVIDTDTASALLTNLAEAAPGVFGYYLALAVTGTAPERPRKPRSAPDQQEADTNHGQGGG